MDHAIKKYLDGVDFDFFESIDGIYVIKEVHHSKGYRYICTYQTGIFNKKRIFDKLRRYGQPEKIRDWEFHHVVEGKHFADIDFKGRYKQSYMEELPCVLIHKKRHSPFTSLFHIRETDVLYRDTLASNILERSRSVATSARDKSNHRDLLNRVEKLESLYVNTYLGDLALQRISRNVFKEARRLLVDTKN